MAGGSFQDRRREGELLWPRTGLGSLRKSFAPLPAPGLGGGIGGRPGLGGGAGGPISRPKLATRPAARGKTFTRSAKRPAHRPDGAISAMAAIATLGPAVTSASTRPRGFPGRISRRHEVVSTAEAAFEGVAEAEDDGPILGLSTRSSCWATSTTASASIASFIMEAKKLMSE